MSVHKTGTVAYKITKQSLRQQTALIEYKIEKLKKIKFSPNIRNRMTYFSHQSDKQSTHLKYSFFFPNNKRKDEVLFASLQEKLDRAIYPFKIFIKSIKCKKTLRVFAETLKNQVYASYIHTFSSTETYLKRIFI